MSGRAVTPTPGSEMHEGMSELRYWLTTAAVWLGGAILAAAALLGLLALLSQCGPTYDFDSPGNYHQPGYPEPEDIDGVEPGW